MQRDADGFISNNDKAFIVQALAEERRIDGRRPYDLRPVTLQFSGDGSSSTVRLGQTCVTAVVSASLDTPRPERQREGSMRFQVDFSPMASPAFEAGRPKEDAQLIIRLLEKAIRNTGMVDMEALCVSAGRKVWNLQVDVTVLNHMGNLTDAVFLAVVAALMAFQRPDVTVDAATSSITVHTPDVRESLPLSLHHIPLSLSFSLFGDGDALVIDPLLKEEAASAGSMAVILNGQGQVCSLHKLGGLGLTLPQVMRLVRIATGKAEELMKILKAALETHNTARLAARVRRQRAAGVAAHGPVIDVPVEAFLAGGHDSSHVQDQLMAEATTLRAEGSPWGSSSAGAQPQMPSPEVSMHDQQALAPSAPLRVHPRSKAVASTSAIAPNAPLHSMALERDGASEFSEPAATSAKEVHHSHPDARSNLARHDAMEGVGASARPDVATDRGREGAEFSQGRSAAASFEAIAARIAGTHLVGGNLPPLPSDKDLSACVKPKSGRSRRRLDAW